MYYHKNWKLELTCFKYFIFTTILSKHDRVEFKNCNMGFRYMINSHLHCRGYVLWARFWQACRDDVIKLHTFLKIRSIFQEKHRISQSGSGAKWRRQNDEICRLLRSIFIPNWIPMLEVHFDINQYYSYRFRAERRKWNTNDTTSTNLDTKCGKCDNIALDWLHGNGSLVYCAKWIGLLHYTCVATFIALQT